MKRLTFLMVLLYFVQAACVNPGLAQLPVAKYLEEELQFTAAELAGFQAIIFLPWFIKPVWGILVDSVPLLGYRMKSYFFICYGLVFTSFLILGQVKTYTLTTLIVAILVISASIAFSDVLTDRLMVVEGQRYQATRPLQAAQWAGLGFGAVGMYLMGGWLADHMPLSIAFFASVIIPCFGLTVVTRFIQEPSGQQSLPIRQHLNTLKQAIQSAQALAILALVFCLGLAPKLPVYIYQSRALLFEDEFIGQLKAIEFLGLGIGAVCFGVVAQRFSQKQLLSSIILFSALASFVFIFMQDARSAVWVSLLAGLATAIATLGILDLFTTVCTKGNEATTYALLVSILNVMTSLGLLLGSWLYDRGLPFPVLVGVCTASALASGILVLLLKPLRCN
ncbi:MAG: hypothetical protein ACTS2F_19830 [Thainema sp.]